MDDDLVRRYLPNDTAPTTEHLFLLGVIVWRASRAETIARLLAATVTQALTPGAPHDWNRLLVNKGPRTHRVWIKTLTEGIETEALPWLPAVLAWLNQAHKAIEQRNGVAHRDVVPAVAITDDPASAWSGPGLLGSRAAHEPIEQLDDQLAEVADELTEVCSAGEELLAHVTVWAHEIQQNAAAKWPGDDGQ